ncbi:MAG: A24 family peptidase [Bacillota bacterium]
MFFIIILVLGLVTGSLLNTYINSFANNSTDYKRKTSFKYPLIEILTGLVFILAFINIGVNIILAKYLCLFSILITIAFIDIDHQIIPNRMVVLVLLWGIFWQIIIPEITLANALGGALIGGGSLFIIALLSKGGMGGGDIKLMFAGGFILGSVLTLLALFISFLAGALFGIILISLNVKSRKDPIPFGPFLSIGMFISTLWGRQILLSYQEIMHVIF